MSEICEALFEIFYMVVKDGLTPESSVAYIYNGGQSP